MSQLVDLINVPRLSDPSISPDGRQIAFVRSDADWGLNKRVTHIWRTASDGTGLQQLTWGVNGESSPRWSPDGAADCAARAVVADASASWGCVSSRRMRRG